MLAGNLQQFHERFFRSHLLLLLLLLLFSLKS
jgi:hypothetical protein